MKDPKRLIDDISGEYDCYIKNHRENNLGYAIDYFDAMLTDFYDKSAIYLLKRYEEEKNDKIEGFMSLEKYSKSLKYYVNGIGFPYIYLYKNYLNKENSKINILDDLIYETRKYLCSLTNNKIIDEAFLTEQCCGLASVKFKKLAKEKGLDSYILTTSNTFGLFDSKLHNRSHAFVLVIVDNKKYIVDCTFSQFTKLFFMNKNAIKLPLCINAEPAYFLNNNKKGKKLLEDILKYGYFEATKENVKLYLDSFVNSERNAYYYLNDNKDNSVKASFYFDIINDTKTLEKQKGIIYKDISDAPLFFGDNQTLGARNDCYLNESQLKKINKIIRFK